jgi:hypothetical protein
VALRADQAQCYLYSRAVVQQHLYRPSNASYLATAAETFAAEAASSDVSSVEFSWHNVQVDEAAYSAVLIHAAMPAVCSRCD